MDGVENAELSGGNNPEVIILILNYISAILRYQNGKG
jgi:hypothetical protein